MNQKTALIDDGTPLKERLAKAMAIQRRRALLLTMPLVIFLVVSFVIPIGQLLWKSVYNPTVSDVLPNFAIDIQQWDGQNLPSETVFQTFVRDLVTAKKNR